jgi:hypothetical protein
MPDAEDPDRWRRLDHGDIVLWREPDGSRVRWHVSEDGWLTLGGIRGPSVEEATAGLSTGMFIKIWDHSASSWGPEVPSEIARPPSPAWLQFGEGDRVVTDIPDGYGVLCLSLDGGRWCLDHFPYGAMPWRSPSHEAEFWKKHGTVEQRIASGGWYKIWDGATQSGRGHT